MKKSLVHKKNLTGNYRRRTGSCLFIGWGEVATRHYYPSLEKIAGRQRLSIIKAEKPGIAAEDPEQFIEWGTAVLDNYLQKGRFEHIFILTPPALHMEQLTYCLKRLDKVDLATNLFVEKPVDFNVKRVKDTLSVWATMPNRRKILVRQIDHYAEKWSVRKIREQVDEVLKITGKLNTILFFSAEKRHIPSSPTYARGYAVEHGVHAWSILFRLFPDILNIEISPDTKHGPSHAWRYTGTLQHCPADTAFMLRFRAHPDEGECDELASETEITIAGGKALGMERKVLVLKGEHGKIMADLSHDEVVSVSEGRKTVLFKNDHTPRTSPYITILNGILGENPTPQDVTLPLEAGLWSLEKINQGISSVKILEEYKAGSMPEALQPFARLAHDL